MIKALMPHSISLHTGGVAGSIPASPTIFPKWFQLLGGRPLPFPPPLDLEQNLKDASRLGEISGTMFAIRSAHLQRRLERRRQSRQPLRPACKGGKKPLFKGSFRHGTKDWKLAGRYFASNRSLNYGHRPCSPPLVIDNETIAHPGLELIVERERYWREM